MTSSALGDLLAARDHLGGRASKAGLVLFARGFGSEVATRAAEEGAALVSAADFSA